MKKTSWAKNMPRSQFLKVVAGLAGGSLAAYIAYEMAPWLDSSAPAERVRRPLQLNGERNPPIRELIRSATLAASGHNTQPWMFHATADSVEIRPDLTCRLAAVDPQDRELWISLGCALENFSLAARKAGFEPDVTYPDTNDLIRVSLSPRLPEESLLFDAISTRQNTRSPYDGVKLPKSATAQVMGVRLEPGITLRLMESHADLEQALEYISQGNRDQFSDKAFIEELVHWIRFDKREALATLDGLYSLCMGSPRVPRWIGQQFIRQMSAEKQIDADAKLLRSSAGAVAIASASETRTDWVRTGQVYQRLALKLTSLNVKSAFLNQPIEAPKVREQFQAAMGFGKTLPQLLFRFGFADQMPSSLRRSVDDVIVWS